MLYFTHLPTLIAKQQACLSDWSGFFNAMRTSKKLVNQNLKKQIHQLLYQVVADIKAPAEAKILLEDFLSKEELEVVTRRLAIAYFIAKGKSYADIKKMLGVSSTTIASIAPQIQKQPGYQLALKKIQAEEWAQNWANKIGGFLKRK